MCSGSRHNRYLPKTRIGPEWEQHMNSFRRKQLLLHVKIGVYFATVIWHFDFTSSVLLHACRIRIDYLTFCNPSFSILEFLYFL
jgi:hypothetical protein